MGRFKHKWKAFLNGRLDKPEAMGLLKFLFSAEGEKEMEKEISAGMEEEVGKAYDNEIASVIQNFKRNRRNTAADIKTRNHFPGKGIFLWAACIGTAIMMVYYAPGFFSGFSPAQSDSQDIEEEVRIIKSNERGKKSKIQLADGSVVFLNASSKLSYSKDFINDRMITLDGEAYFEVAEDSLKPFRVLSGDIETVALGTAFNVNAYHKNNVQVALATGKVLVSHQKSKSKIVLKPGEYTEYRPREEELKKLPIDKDKISLWKDGILYFEKKPFKELIPLLENWYNVDFEIRGSMPADFCTGRFEKKEYLSSVLKVLEHSIGFSFQIEGNKVIIYN